MGSRLLSRYGDVLSIFFFLLTSEMESLWMINFCQIKARNLCRIPTRPFFARAGQTSPFNPLLGADKLHHRPNPQYH